MHQSVTIRDFRHPDLPALLALQAECFAAAAWLPEDYLRLAADPSGLLLVAEPTDSAPDGPAMGGVAPGAIDGFVLFLRLGDDAELENLAVALNRRRQGVARQLVDAGHRRLRAAGVKRVFLEVRPSNQPALALYASMGYTPSRVRKEYYHDPDEDALVLQISL
ncbi:MAG TPA: GNAT family N-acetyltransferase [Terriglobia bacterium]|nr:GNAT family N-acetyltransferase [Terriglobia bacterium]